MTAENKELSGSKVLCHTKTRFPGEEFIGHKNNRVTIYKFNLLTPVKALAIIN